jgi:phosphatidylglycerol:prolipoprotein diacylglycerol transferase
MLSASLLASAHLPYFHLGALDIGIPIQSFGMLVAAGVLIGAALLRRYAEWHGISDEHIRGLTGWTTVAGFLGAHLFDVLAYQWDELMADPILLFKIWAGISSYGGFIGGFTGFAIYVWWKRLPAPLFADVLMVGGLPAFTIGRIGCTVVSDHIGAATDFFLGMDYPRALNLAHLAERYPGTGPVIRAWNLGLVEFLYLVPVNLLVLWLAFRPAKRLAAGVVAALIGVLYAPVRFGLDFLRPEDTDPRYGGLTFAQWSSILALGVAVAMLVRLLRSGTPAVPVAPTSGEAQARLKLGEKDPRDDDGGGGKGDGGKK